MVYPVVRVTVVWLTRLLLKDEENALKWPFRYLPFRLWVRVVAPPLVRVGLKQVVYYYRPDKVFWPVLRLLVAPEIRERVVLIFSIVVPKFHKSQFNTFNRRLCLYLRLPKVYIDIQNVEVCRSKTS